jgi:hypothetical protein
MSRPCEDSFPGSFSESDWTAFHSDHRQRKRFCSRNARGWVIPWLRRPTPVMDDTINSDAKFQHAPAQAMLASNKTRTATSTQQLLISPQGHKYVTTLM